MFLSKSRHLALVFSLFVRVSKAPCTTARLRYSCLADLTMPKRKSRGGGQQSPAAKAAHTDNTTSPGAAQAQAQAVDAQPLDDSIGCEAEANMRAYKDTANGSMAVQEVSEGKATIVYPDTVFYNNVQEFNRDLTVTVITEYAKSMAAGVGVVPQKGVRNENGVRILEALGASGLRSMRFAKEIPGVKEIVCNDFDDKAVEYIRKNIEKNEVGHLVTANKGDAALMMAQCKQVESKFDVIDLDPYGSPSHFLEGAVQAIKDGGLLCVTATDMAVMSGNFGETCYTKYGSYAIRTKSCHEMGLRILLRAIESHATRYSKYTVPILSVSADFYIRVFVRVYEGAAMAKFSASKQGLVYQCNGCGAQTVQPLGYSILQENGQYKHVPGTGPPVGKHCEYCGERHKLGGPIWIGRLHDKAFVTEVLDTLKQKNQDQLGTHRRMLGTLKLIDEEMEDVVLYYVMEEFSRTLHCTTMPSVKFRSALLNAGYQVSGSHANRNAIKTTAPMSVIWDILRLWIQQNPISQKRLLSDHVARRILEIPSNIAVSFEKHDDANPESKEQGFLRFQMNPQKDWGPKSRPRGPGEDGEAPKKKPKRKKSKKHVPCNQTVAGKECPQGEECPYSHDPELAKNFIPFLKRLPCKKFLQGKCEQEEENCRMHHKGDFALDAKGNPKPNKADLAKTATDEEMTEAIADSMKVELQSPEPVMIETA